MMNNKPHYRIPKNASLIIATVVMLISMSSITQAFGQREIYPFDPDFSINYATHEVLYKDFKKYHSINTVAYESFFSKHALENGFTHCRIEYTSPSLTKREDSIIINFNAEGFITSLVAFTDSGRVFYKEYYTYSIDKKQITVNWSAISRSNNKKLLITNIYYFNDQYLLDSSSHKNPKDANYHWQRQAYYLYDSTSKIRHISKVYNGEREEFDLSFNSKVYWLDTPRIRKIMAEDSPESLFSKDSSGTFEVFTSRKLYNHQNSYATLYLSANKLYFRELFAIKYDPPYQYSFQYPKFSQYNNFAYYEWDNKGNLSRFSQYHADENIILRSESTGYFAEVLNQDSLLHKKFSSWQSRELVVEKYPFSSNKIILPDIIITYYK